MERDFRNLLSRINNELEDIKSDKELTTKDQAFGFWAAEHILHVDPNDAEIGVPGHEHGIDILTIDNQNKKIIISQVKWSDNLEHTLETAEIDKLSNAPNYLYDESVTGNNIFNEKKDEFRDAIDGDDEYTIHLKLIVVGNFTADQNDKMESLDNSTKRIGNKEFNIRYFGSDKSKIYDLVYHPETPDITLEVESIMEFKNQERRDVFAIIKGVELNKKLKKEDYIPLFEYNPRFYLDMNENDDANINSGIKKSATSNEDSKNFLEYNNGVTSVCDSFELENNLLHIKNLKVVNGCQTVVSLGKAEKNVTDDVYLLCKLYEIRDDDDGEMKRSISKFTNSQNAMTIRNMASDHPMQISIQHHIDNNHGRFFWERKDGEKLLHNTDDVWKRKHAPAGFRIINNFKVAKIVYAWYYEKPYESVMLKESEIFNEKESIFKKIFNEIPVKEFILSWILEQILSKTISYLRKSENQVNLVSYISTYSYESDSVIKLLNSQYSKANCLALIHHFLKAHAKYDEIIDAIIKLMSKPNILKFPDEHKHIMPIFLCIMQFFDLQFRDKHYDGGSILDVEAKDVRLCFEDNDAYGEILNKVISQDKLLDGKITNTLNGYFEKILTES